MKQDCVYYDDDQISINIPQRLYEAVNSYPFVDVCGEELNLVLLDKLLLSAESAMFRIQEAGKPEFTWKQFLSALAQSGDMRKAIKEAVLRVINDFDYSRLDFTGKNTPEAEPQPLCDDFYDIYSAVEGECVVHYIALFVEREQYCRLCAAKSNYSWIEYTRELMKGSKLAEAARSAVIEAVGALDFRVLFE